MALDLRQGVVAGGRQCRAYRPVHVAAFCPAGCWVQHRMPEAVRQEFLHLRENPDLNRIRYHEIIDDWYGLQFSDPSIASTDWLTLGGLVLFVTPLIIMLGLLAARPLARQFGLLTRASAAIAQGRFTTRSKMDASAPSELMLFTQNFNTMAERLERYDRELRASHVAAAHELRSPLTAAVGRLQGMMDGVFPADKAQMNMVMNQLLSLSRLIDDLHLLSLADAGQLTLNKQRFSPAGLLQEKIALATATGYRRAFRLRHGYPSGRMLCGPAANRTGLYHFNGERTALRDGRREANDTGFRSVRLLDVLLPGLRRGRRTGFSAGDV